MNSTDNFSASGNNNIVNKRTICSFGQIKFENKGLLNDNIQLELLPDCSQI